MSEYNRLAWFYNKYWTTFAPELFCDLLDNFFLPDLRDRAEILDLCCGTGQVSAKLAEDGFSVTGVDISDGMLSIARSNAPTAEFIKADAVNLNLDRKFDLVISFFDSMNHILEADELKQCFASVRKMLKSGASFIFDLNDEQTFENLYENSFSAVEDDNICILKAVYERKTQIAAYFITTFKLDGGVWHREDMSVYERYYAPEDIVRMLTETGFTNIRVLHGEDDLEIEAFEGRLFFTASVL